MYIRDDSFDYIIINQFSYSLQPGTQELVEVKEKYTILRKHLRETNNEKYHMLHRTIPITGMKRMRGSVGSNTNKGGEIVVCLDGKTNEIFPCSYS